MKKLLLGLLLSFAMVTPALAAKPVPLTGTISISPETPVYGQLITMTLDTNASPTEAGLTCYQNGIVVAQGYGLIESVSHYALDVALNSPSWTGGAADCTARIDKIVIKHDVTYKTVATLDFHVNP